MAGSLTMDREYFERMYAHDDDPWAFETSWYERRKYALTMAALPHARYQRAFEPGCSIGVLTSLLAERCDQLVAMEHLPAVAARARSRLRAQSGATVLEGSIPSDWPVGTFDLIVLSEVAYYLTEEGLCLALEHARRSLRRKDTLVSVHYLLETNYPLSGQRVGQVLRNQAWLKTLSCYTEESFELLVFAAC
jgi:SAM-dependent methyltransferase